MRARPALLLAGIVTASILASLPAAAETPAPLPPPADPPAAVAPPPPLPPPLAPVVPVAPEPVLAIRSPGALGGGLGAVAVGGILLVASAFSGSVQATCNQGCNHTPLIIGLVASGATLVAVGIPLIIWGARRVPVVAPAAAVAWVPRKTLPSWAGTAGPEGWMLRF